MKENLYTYNLTDSQWEEACSGRLISEIDTAENTYLIVEDEFNNNKTTIFKHKNDALQQVHFKTIENSTTGTIKPRNTEQICAIDMLKDDSIKVKVITGKFGTGKDFLMLNAAFEAIAAKKYEGILYVRNNVEVKDTVPLGALPGEKEDKMLPWLMPLADHVGGLIGLEMMMEKGQVASEHLGFLRGRDIKNTIVYVTEAENLTTAHVQLLLGRIGEGSALWLNGDFKQTDRAIFESQSGLNKIISKLGGNPLFGHVRLLKTERSEVAALADLLDD